MKAFYGIMGAAFIFFEEVKPMKLAHVTVQTCHFDREIRFYREIVGLSIQNEFTGMGRHIVFLSDGAGSTPIEIIHRPDADNSGNEHLSLGFHSGDAAALRESLLAAGCAPSPMVSPAPGVQFFFVKDPAGVTVQFM